MNFLLALLFFTILYSHSIEAQLENNINTSCSECRYEEKRILNLIKIKFNDKKYSEVVQEILKYQKKYPYSSMLKYWLGKAYLYIPSISVRTRDIDYQKGIKHLKDTLKIYEPSIQKDCFSKKCVFSNKVFIYLDTAQHLFLGYYMLSQYDIAMTYLKKIFKVKLYKEKRYLKKIHYNLGVLFESMNKNAEAKESFHLYLLGQI